MLCVEGIRQIRRKIIVELRIETFIKIITEKPIKLNPMSKKMKIKEMYNKDCLKITRFLAI